MAAAKRLAWMLTAGTGALVLANLGFVTPFSVKAQQTAAPSVTFAKGRRPDSAAQLPELPSARRRGADVARHVRRSRPYAKAINQRTHIGPHTGVMPPWYIEKNIGIQHYKNDPSLSERRAREDREMGRRRRAARQSGRHAAARGRSRA